LETDGVDINILVSRAYGQDEIDEKITKRALEDAKAAIRQSKDKVKIEEARALLRRSVVDLKLLKKRRK
jgi:F-type H+-transporting ATPase subunit epsilon